MVECALRDGRWIVPRGRRTLGDRLRRRHFSPLFASR
jgi:hypothetical protein